MSSCLYLFDKIVAIKQNGNCESVSLLILLESHLVRLSTSKQNPSNSTFNSAARTYWLSTQGSDRGYRILINKGQLSHNRTSVLQNQMATSGFPGLPSFYSVGCWTLSTLKLDSRKIYQITAWKYRNYVILFFLEVRRPSAHFTGSRKTCHRGFIEKVEVSPYFVISMIWNRMDGVLLDDGYNK